MFKALGHIFEMETYYGYVRTPADAIKLFEACRLGLLPRVQRRLSEKERQSIRSGSVFVWDEREAGMRRWTDGKSWSASRVSGSFLTYREMEGKRGGGGFNSIRRGSNKTPDSGRGSDEDRDDGEPEGYRYKADGLMKQSFSITTSSGQHLHLISYYSRPQHGQADLPQPTNDPQLRSIVPVKGMYPESSMGEASQTPALTRAPMQQPYMVPAPQHHHHHHPPPPHYGLQYAPQPGYGWPPSPAQTPPYSHYTTAYQQPPPLAHAPPPHYAPQYELPRVALPLPPPQKPSYPPHQSYRMPSPPRINDPPRDQTLQAAAQAVMVDPRLGPTSARNPQGPLPALHAVTSGPAGSSLAAEVAPSARGRSVTPPRSSHSESNSAANQSRSNLSSLLHPTTAPSEGSAASANGSGSATGSPRASGGAPPPGEPGNLSEDTRALRMLDRSAFRRIALA